MNKTTTDYSFQRITLINKLGMSITLTDWGASWLSCKLPMLDGTQREVLLACQHPRQHNNSYMGTTVGRYANRLQSAVIKEGNIKYNLRPNQGRHQLHGGPDGFSERQWSILLQLPNRIIMGLVSADGDQGFPGTVCVSVDYLLTEDNQVIINYLANTTKRSPINLTNHAYFNLDGKGDILHHALFVDANEYLPVDQEGIPRCGLTPVTQGNMDLRRPIVLAESFLDCSERQIMHGYDHAYLLRPQVRNLNAIAASLTSSDQRVTLSISTDQPAIQIYTGNGLNGVMNRDGESYQNYAGIALETQLLPDSPNHPEWAFKPCWISANEIYHTTSCYSFHIN